MSEIIEKDIDQVDDCKCRDSDKVLNFSIIEQQLDEELIKELAHYKDFDVALGYEILMLN